MKLISGTVLQSATRFTVKVLVVAAATVGGGALISSNVFASLSTIATAATSVNAGTLFLNAPANGASSVGFTTEITGMKPGDTVHRFVNYQNGGNMDISSLKLWITDSGTATLLTSDTSTALTVVVSYCAVAWTVPDTTTAATCVGSPGSAWLSTTSLKTINAEITAASFTGAPTIAAGATAFLKFDIKLPDRDERRINGATATTNSLGATLSPAGSIQGLTAAFTWTLYGAQAAIPSDTNG